MRVELRPHQQEAVAKMHNGCILYGDVGVGKTITSLGYYFEKVCGGQLNKWGSMTTPKDVYVITTAKVRDGKAFELQAAKMGVHEDRNISTNGVKITVDSWNNLHKYVEVKDAFFIFDEQRVVGYGAWSKAFIKVAKHNEWVLLSATPGDTWLDYIPVFIANGWYKHKTDFTDQHVIWMPRVKFPKVLRYQNVGLLVRRRNDVLVRMPYEKHTKRHQIDVIVDYNQDKFDQVVKKRWHVYENRPLRDVSELFSVMRKVVNSDSSRVNAIKALLKKHPKLIVFYNFDYELEMLRTLGSTAQEPSGLETTTKSESSCSPELSTISSAEESSDQSLSDLSEIAYNSGLPIFSSEDPSPRKSPSTSIKQSTDSSNPQTRDPSLKKKSPAAEAIESSKNGQDPWEFLLSPEGLGANSSNPSNTQLSNEIISSSSEKKATNFGSSTQKPRKSTDTSQPAFAIAEWNGHKHEQIPATERWLYLVQYRAGAEGWNCTDTDAVVFFSQTYSYRDWWQAHGRIDRINTPFTDLYYYYLFSRSIIDKAIRAALKAKKSFNERSLHFDPIAA